MTERCGRRLANLWKLRLNRTGDPGPRGWLRRARPGSGDVLRDPDGREDRLAVVVLMVLRARPDRDADCIMAPGDDFVLAPDDEVLLLGETAARRGLDMTALIDAACEYVRTGQHVPTSWVWRRLAVRPGGRSR